MRPSRWSLISLPVAVLFSLVVGAQPAGAAFPGLDGMVAYAAMSGEVHQIFEVRSDGFYPHLLVDLPGQDSRDPAWSADGRRIAFDAMTSAGHSAIYAAAASGSNPTQVTDGLQDDTHPSWAPDGTRIAFQRDLGGGKSAIFVMNADGSNVTQLTDGTQQEQEPAWSPDGSTIAYSALTYPATLCSTCLRSIFIVDTSSSAVPRDVVNINVDLSHPDWSPDGSQIAFEIDPSPAPNAIATVELATGALGAVNSLYGLADPAWSPQSDRFVAVATGWADALVLLDSNLNVVASPNPGPALDPAWQPVVASPPTITFTANPNAYGWFGVNSSIGVQAADPDGIDSLSCTDGSEHSRSSVDGNGFTVVSGTFWLRTPGQGVIVTCDAADIFGTTATESISVNVDLTPPQASDATVTPSVIAAGQTALVTASATDDLSGVAKGFLQPVPSSNANQPVTLMTYSGTSLSATVGPDLPPDLYRLSITPFDRADNQGFSTGCDLVVYDPASSSEGSGWIVPGAPGSGDVLPGLDGKTKASFGFGVKYKSSTATAPSGPFNFSYGSGFKFQSVGLDWLVVVDQRLAYLQGTGTVDGMSGIFPFRATITDGASTGEPDHLLVRIYAPGAEPSAGPTLYQASGDAGGQIKIKP